MKLSWIIPTLVATIFFSWINWNNDARVQAFLILRMGIGSVLIISLTGIFFELSKAIRITERTRVRRNRSQIVVQKLSTKNKKQLFDCES